MDSSYANMKKNAHSYSYLRGYKLKHIIKTMFFSDVQELKTDNVLTWVWERSTGVAIKEQFCTIKI